MKNKDVPLFSIFWSFFSVGLITFGGGYAMLPFLEREICDKKNWITSDDLFDFYALGQCTPGIIAINVSTYIGYDKRGLLGAIFGSIGIIAPSVIIITVISALFMNFQSNVYVIAAISGIKVVVCAIMTHTIYKLVKKSIVDKATFVLFLLALVALFLFNVNIIILIICSIILGIFIRKIQRKMNNVK